LLFDYFIFNVFCFMIIIIIIIMIMRFTYMRLENLMILKTILRVNVGEGLIVIYLHFCCL